MTEPGGSGLRGVHQLPGSRGPAHTSIQLTEVPQAACLPARPPACDSQQAGERGREGRKEASEEGRKGGRAGKMDEA